MTTAFPAGLDDFENPDPTDLLTGPPPHSSQHGDANDAIEALEAKVGVDGSAVTTSLDYRVQQLEDAGGGGGGGGGFDPIAPDDISGLKVWISGDTITGLSDGDPVASWPDQSGNSNDFSQSTSGEKPTYQTSEINGLAVVRFDATDDGMTGTYSRSSNPLSVIAVYNYRGSSLSNRRAVQGSTNWIMGPYSNGYRFYNGAFAPVGPALSTVFRIHSVVQTAIAGAHWVDGDGYGNTALNGTPGTINLGAEGAFNEPLDGDIAEVIVYDVELTPKERRGVEQWLRDKYAL